MLGASLVLGLSLFAQAPTHVVGTARIDVTPSYAVRLSGYGNVAGEALRSAARELSTRTTFGAQRCRGGR